MNCLQQQSDCEEEEMWLDPGKGVFCRGPPGPTPRLNFWTFYNEELPLTAELVQEDVLLRFLAGLKSKHVDDVVVRGVAYSGAFTFVPERVLRPTVISRLTNAPIAVANNTWTSLYDSLSDRKLLADGMTRFTLNGGDYLSLRWNWVVKEAWMLQAWSVFGAGGISMEEDLSVYHLVLPDALMSGHLSDSEAQLPLEDGALMLAAHLSAPEGPIAAHPIKKPLEATNYNARRSSFWSPIFLPPSSEISGSSGTPAHTRDLDIEDID
ncbi:hypothetical protein PQX77_017683 [Marasmius sp. AFHP31]|nr:hypothetical protein PQX77_017683 [Marasmius sp. AFHP31]